MKKWQVGFNPVKYEVKWFGKSNSGRTFRQGPYEWSWVASPWLAGNGYVVG